MDLDRFDRMLLRCDQPAPAPATPPRVTVPPRVVATPPVITSKRGPKYVDYTPCPMCGFHRIGIEYHGELMSGAKVHTLAAHSPGAGAVRNGKPRCMAAGVRLVFEGGVWKGAPS